MIYRIIPFIFLYFWMVFGVYLCGDWLGIHTYADGLIIVGALYALSRWEASCCALLLGIWLDSLQATPWYLHTFLLIAGVCILHGRYYRALFAFHIRLKVFLLNVMGHSCYLAFMFIIYHVPFYYGFYYLSSIGLSALMVAWVMPYCFMLQTRFIWIQRYTLEK